MSSANTAAAHVRVVLIDDSRSYLRAVERVLSRYPQIELVGTAEDAETGRYVVQNKLPDVALVDVRMPYASGIELTATLTETVPAVHVLAFSVSDSEDDLLEMLRAGARGYVLKSCLPDEVVQAVFAAARGESWLSPPIASKLIAEFTRLPPAQIRPALIGSMRLTPREQAVLRQLALGKTNSEISSALGIAETTVKSHLKNILEKLHVRNRLEAALLAMQHATHL